MEALQDYYNDYYEQTELIGDGVITQIGTEIKISKSEKGAEYLRGELRFTVFNKETKRNAELTLGANLYVKHLAGFSVRSKKGKVTPASLGDTVTMRVGPSTDKQGNPNFIVTTCFKGGAMAKEDISALNGALGLSTGVTKAPKTVATDPVEGETLEESQK